MASTGDYVLPHLNELPYLDKPLLYFAVGAITMRVLGPTEFAARFPSLLFTIGTIVLVGWLARKMFGSRAVLPAVVATAATPFTLAYARVVIFDSALTFFVVLAISSFYLAMEETKEASADSGKGWTSLAWVAIGFGVLTKGPIAIILPLLVALPYGIRYRTWKVLADPISLVLFAVIVGPWILAVSLRIPDFLEYSLVTETIRRFSTTELERTGPAWYFLPMLPAAALPWSLVAISCVSVLWKLRDDQNRLDRRITFLLLWIFVPLIFFSVSQSKRPQYILPLVPAIALLVAGAWYQRSKNFAGSRIAAVGLFVLGSFFLLVHQHIADLFPASSGVAEAIPGTALGLGVVSVLGAVLAWFARSHRELLLLALSLPVVAIPFTSRKLMSEIGEDRSARTMAHAIRDIGGDRVRVVGIGAFPQSLPFYLKRAMIVSTPDGSEITSNYLIRRFDEFRGLGSTLQDSEWWKEALVTCPQPTIFVTRNNNDIVRESLSAYLDLVYSGRKYSAYGPCGPETFALMGR
ncbi:MAG: glycosyltransferase family 39 protein [Myxococcota bacterium]|nr:glycosyltransferase family 39 protein [Myxococcota bacterium]